MNIRKLIGQIAKISYREIMETVKGEVHYIGGAEALPQALDKNQEAELLEKIDTKEAKDTLI